MSTSPSDTKYDLAIVGGGIVGVFHALAASRRGLSVAVLEKNGEAEDASVRNFGSFIPSAFGPKWRALGRRSRELYLALQEEEGVDLGLRPNGAIYVAHDDDESTLLREAHAIDAAGENPYPSELLDKDAVLARCPGMKQGYPLLGLFYPEDCTVEPRIAVHNVLAHLERRGVAVCRDTAVVSLDETEGGVAVRTNNSEVGTLRAGKVIVCSGHDVRTLCHGSAEVADRYKEVDLVKLHMMRTGPQPEGWQMGGSVMGGLTIRRYEHFKECPSYKEIKAREVAENPENVKYGVHIIFKQAADGTVLLGDSHEYAPAVPGGAAALGFDYDTHIEKLLLAEAAKMIDLPAPEIETRWIGFYGQCRSTDLLEFDASPNVHVMTGIGGKGMTSSPALGEKTIEKLFPKHTTAA